MSKAAAQTSGIVLCSRYAFKPNELGYCGPDEAAGLFEMTLAGQRTRGYEYLLKHFQTLHPYLSLIAGSMGARDEFDPAVVQAYWLGAPVARNISLNRFRNHFSDSLNLKKKLSRPAFEQLVGKIPAGAQPNHNFHVLNVFTRTGHVTQPHTVATMDQCRISWGEVIGVERDHLTVDRRRLIRSHGQLQLNEPELKRVRYRWQGEALIDPPQLGQTVAIHWGWVCDIINPTQTAGLKYSTSAAIRFHNQSR